MRKTTTVATIAIAHSLCIISLSVAFLIPVPHHQGATKKMPPVSSRSLHVFTTQSMIHHDNANSVQPAADQEEAVVMDIREIMALLEQTYPDDNNSNGYIKQRWAKTRKYLYQYRANASRTSSTIKSPDDQTTLKRRKRQNNNRGPLTISHVQQILSFLESTFPNHPELQAQILQHSPRILGQYHSIESRLIPTVEFLQGLYGGMVGSDGTAGGMFHEAISRNTNLLLVRGVGYSAGRGGIGSSRGIESVGGEGGDSRNNTLVVEKYLQDELSVSSAGIAKLKRNHPSLFQLSLNSKVKPVVQYLYSLLGYSDTTGVPPRTKQTKQVAKIVTNYPVLLQLDVAANLGPTACFLRDSCDLTDKELAMVITATPGVLGLSVEDNLKPTIQFIEDVLVSGGIVQKKVDANNGNGGEDATKTLLRKCILKHPQILALSLSNLSAKRDYFDGIDGDDDDAHSGDESIKGRKPTLAARILVSAPSTYSLSLKENISPKIEYLASLWGNQKPSSCTKEGGDGEGSFLSDSLREYPQILTLSKEGNIIPTLSFYNMTGYIALDMDGLPRTQNSTMQQKNVMIRSRYIATSLYNRLLPRWHFLANTKPSSKETITSSANLPPLHLLAGASDDVFCRQMKLSLKDYLAFKEEAVPRLKFSSQFDMWLKTGRPIDLATTE